jgi:hypothetical protein
MNRNTRKPHARITESNGRLFVTVRNRREPLVDPLAADRRLRALVEDGFVIEDPQHLLDLWGVWPADGSAPADDDADAAGYPALFAPPAGSPMGDAVEHEFELMREYEREQL